MQLSLVWQKVFTSRLINNKETREWLLVHLVSFVSYGNFHAGNL